MIQIHFKTLNSWMSNNSFAAIHASEAWWRCRYLHPLLAARIEDEVDMDFDDGAHRAARFIYDEKTAPNPPASGSIDLQHVCDCNEATLKHEAYFLSPKTLSLHLALLSKLLVLLPGGEVKRCMTETLFIVVIHTISDKISLRQVAKTFLEELVSRDHAPRILHKIDTCLRVPAAQELLSWTASKELYASYRSDG